MNTPPVCSHCRQPYSPGDVLLPGDPELCAGCLLRIATGLLGLPEPPVRPAREPLAAYSVGRGFPATGFDDEEPDDD